MFVDGTDLTKLKGAELRRRHRDLQLMFQDPYSSLDPRMRVGTIIREPLVVQGIGTATEQRERVAALLREVGLPPHAVELYPHEFSGGQRQRIGLARALALNPRLIVTDEPVSALDVSIRSQILNLMKRLQANHGLTYVFISHDLSVVRYLADRIAVMYLGKLVEIGTGDDIYARPAHPYTAGLIASIPVPNPAVQRPGQHPHHGRAAVAAQPALGLPVPHPLPKGAGPVRRRGAGAQPVRRRAFRRLLLPPPGATEGSSGGYASGLRAQTPAWSPKGPAVAAIASRVRARTPASPRRAPPR